MNAFFYKSACASFDWGTWPQDGLDAPTHGAHTMWFWILNKSNLILILGLKRSAANILVSDFTLANPNPYGLIGKAAKNSV